MSTVTARLVTEDGARRVARTVLWTERSVFLDGAEGLRIGEAVQLELAGGPLPATVALVSEAPRGVVLAFDRADRVARWDDEGETGRHDTRATLRSLAASDVPFDSEEPTNPGLRAVGAGLPPDEKTPTDPATTRLRATTQVGPLPDEDPTEGA